MKRSRLTGQIDQVEKYIVGRPQATYDSCISTTFYIVLEALSRMYKKPSYKLSISTINGILTGNERRRISNNRHSSPQTWGIASSSPILAVQSDNFSLIEAADKFNNRKSESARGTVAVAFPNAEMKDLVSMLNYSFPLISLEVNNLASLLNAPERLGYKLKKPYYDETNSEIMLEHIVVVSDIDTSAQRIYLVDTNRKDIMNNRYGPSEQHAPTSFGFDEIESLWNGAALVMIPESLRNSVTPSKLKPLDSYSDSVGG